MKSVKISKKYTIGEKSKLKRKYTLMTVFIFSSIFLVFISKSIFANTDNILLYIYGVLVTFVLFLTLYYAFFKYQDPAILAEIKEREDLEKGIEPKCPLVTLMVAVYNEESIVEQCIASLILQDYDNKEIIIVDDGSTDNTPKILDQYTNEKNVKVIHQVNAGKKRALGQAMRESNGSIFIFTDSDSILAKDAVSRIVKVFNLYPDVGGVSGHFRLKNSKKNILTKAQDSWVEGQFSIRKAFESCFGAVTCVSGPLAAFRRESIYNFIPAWEKDSFLGQEFRFSTDRTLTGFLLGNKYIGPKLKKKFADEYCVKSINYPEKDWKVVYAKSAKSWTVLPDNMKSLTRQHIRWKKSFLRNIFFTGSFYYHKPIIPVFVYYLHILFVLVGPFITFRHLIYMPLNGNIWSPFCYLFGIMFVGFIFGFAYKIENENCHLWMYRPFMSLLSTLYLSFLIFISVFTIKKMVWHRD